MSVSMITRINVFPKCKYDLIGFYMCIKLKTEQHLYIHWDTDKKLFYISQRVTTTDYFEIYKDVYSDLGIIDKFEEQALGLGPIKNILFKYYPENELNKLITLWKLQGYEFNMF